MLFSGSRAFVAVVIACSSCPSIVGAAPIVGQIDTFQTLTTEGWTAGNAQGGGNPALPAVIASGGPSGAGDAFLRLTSIGGSGAGSKLTAFNMAQWAGDYSAAGVAGIGMDVRNTGTTDLALRLLFAGPFPAMGPPGNVAISSVVNVPAGSGWQPAIFPLTPGSLTSGLPFGSVLGALQNAEELRLFHNPAAQFAGPGGDAIPSIVATLDIDNITALGQAQTVPEPSSIVLLGAGVVTLARRMRSRRRA